MRRPTEIAHDEQSMTTLVDLTNAFEGIASMRIAQIKNQVLQSTKFFNGLWAMYSQLRVGEEFQFGRETHDEIIDKELYIIITAEGGFSGDIDQKLVTLMLQTYKPDQHDIVVIGRHGAAQLHQQGINYKKYFKMPTRDTNFNVMPLVELIKGYRSTSLFYQEYESLMSQTVKMIELSNAVKQRGYRNAYSEEIISEATYIFEPSTYAVSAHLERSMTQIALSQLILQSKLAQYASRFRAMSASHRRAKERRDDLHMDFNRSRRMVKDERLKEIVNGLKKSKTGARL